MSYVNRPLIVIVVQTDSTRIGGATAVIKKTSERELKEAMKGLAVIQKLVGLIRFRRLRVPEFIWVDGIEITRVRRILDARYVRRNLATQTLLEVDACEEWMRLDLIRVLS